MKFEFEIDIATFEGPMREVVGAAVRRVIEDRAREFMRRYTSQIEAAVDLYLAKRLTDSDIKQHIDKSIAHLVQERIENEL